MRWKSIVPLEGDRYSFYLLFSTAPSLCSDLRLFSALECRCELNADYLGISWDESNFYYICVNIELFIAIASIVKSLWTGASR